MKLRLLELEAERRPGVNRARVTFRNAGVGESLSPGYPLEVEARPLHDQEKALLDLLLSRDFAGRRELVAQAETVLTAGSSCSCGCPSFSLVADRSLPPAAVSEAMVSDAHGSDPGGNKVGVLLFTEDGYLSEIEVFGWEGSTFDGLPEPDSRKLSEWGEPNESGTRWLLNP